MTEARDYTDATEAERLEAIRGLGLSISPEFVPWSKSRHAGEKQPSLNWRVTMLYTPGPETAPSGQRGETRAFPIGKPIDYSEGCAHAPAYKLPYRDSVDGQELLRWECENGKRGRNLATIGYVSSLSALKPSEVSFWASIVMDSEVIEYATFEEWADSFGYDPDSRKHEAIYRACLEIALVLRNGIGETKLAELRRIVEGY